MIYKVKKISFHVLFKDGIKFHVYNIINDSVNHSSLFTSIKVKKNLRKSQAEFWELRKLRLRQVMIFL